MAALKKIYDTREGYLNAAIKLLDEGLLRPNGYKLPKKVMSTVGFARGNAKAIGMCWPAEMATDGKTIHVSVCPTLNEPVRALDVLLHELGHATGISGHGKEFRAFMKAVGLEGKPKSTIANKGTPLYKALQGFAKELGRYPHVAIKERPPSTGQGGGGWVRLVSVNNDDYKVVISPKAIEEFGLPRDYQGDLMVPANAAARAACEGADLFR